MNGELVVRTSSARGDGRWAPPEEGSQKKSLGLQKQGPGTTQIRVEGPVIRVPSSSPEGNGEGWPVDPRAWVKVCAHVESDVHAGCCMGKAGRGPRCRRFVSLPTFISGLAYFSLKPARISCGCEILQLLTGCFCDLGNYEGNINKQQQNQFSKEVSERHISLSRWNKSHPLPGPLPNNHAL